MMLRMFIFLIAMVTIVPASSDQTTDAKTISIVLTRSGSTFPANQSGIELTTTVHKVAAGERLSNVLEKRGIVPTTDAIGYVYNLNPDVDFEKLPAGTTLYMPALTGRPRGTEAVLILDAAEKSQLSERAVALDLVAESWPKSNAVAFDDETTRKDFEALISEISAYVHDLNIVAREGGRPVPRTVLVDTANEAQYVGSMLSGLEASKERVSTSHLRQLRSVRDDLRIRARSLDETKGPADLPPRWRTVRVTVRTVDGKNTDVRNLRVYYAPEALAGDASFASTFSRLSTPTDELLPEANYAVWASDPTTKERRSEVGVIKARQSKEPLILDLVIGAQR